MIGLGTHLDWTRIIGLTTGLDFMLHCWAGSGVFQKPIKAIFLVYTNFLLVFFCDYALIYSVKR